MFNLAHKIRLYPTPVQAQRLAQAAGTARFSYNWALNQWQSQYTKSKSAPNIPKPSLKSIKQEWSRIKHSQFPWIEDSPSNANLQAVDDLGNAFKRFFQKKARYPKFKRKGQHDSFYVDNQKLKIKGKRAHIPKIGRVKLAEELRFQGRILSGTVSKEVDQWYLSVSIELPDASPFEEKRTGNGIIGLDLGLKTLGTLSTGEVFENPKPLKKSLRKLKRLQRKHSRKIKGSKNREKSRILVGRLHRRIKRIRTDSIHKMTTQICRENQTIVIEDLNVKGMVRNRRLSRSLSDAAFGEIRRQLKYKSSLYEVELVLANRFYPSSKTCSNCGSLKANLKLSDRVFVCPDCGLKIERDLNAALNLKNTLGHRGIKKAYGEIVKPIPQRGGVDLNEVGKETF